MLTYCQLDILIQESVLENDVCKVATIFAGPIIHRPVSYHCPRLHRETNTRFERRYSHFRFAETFPAEIAGSSYRMP